jgi:NADPH-dependent ferric siderophore reductase
MLGDETALPAIARAAEEFPVGTPITAFVEIHDEREQQTIDAQTDLNLTWCDRKGVGAGTTDLLFDAAKSFPIPDGVGLILIGGEAGTVTKIRRYFVNEVGFPKDFIVASGHWKLNVADWDHHEELEN